MACSIIRNKESNEIEKVLAPNGKESILFNNILNSITNKEQALKSWAQVYTPSFKAWFGDWEKGEGSKVVDSNGEPLLVYHGTGNKFEEFDKALRGETTGRSTTGEFDSENAFFFSNKENVSFHYAIMARQQELDLIANTLSNLGWSFTPTEEKQKLYNNLRKESPKFAKYIDDLKSQGLNNDQIKEKLKDLTKIYTKLYSDYGKGGAISNPRRFYRNIKEHTLRVIKNKENILQGNYGVKSVYDDKTLRTTNKYDKHLVVYDDGLIVFDPAGYPELANLQRKNITNISSNDFDKLMNAFLETVKQGEEKIENDLKKGGFTPEIMPVFLNARNVIQKDFKGQPFVMQIDGRGAANEASKLTLKAKEEGKDGVLFENIQDPEVSNNYGVFEPNQIKSLYNEGGFSVEKNNIYAQSEDMPASEASEETVAMMKKAAEQMGIGIQDLLDYAKANPNVDVKNVNGLADIIKKTIAIAQGKEDVTLVEEIVHVATAMLEQTNPKLVTELISKIDRFKIYKEVFEVYSKKKEYQLANGKPDIRKIKKEAVDKLIAEVVVYQSEGSTQYPELMQEETRNIIQNWWQTILDYIRGMYKKSNIDIFQEAGTIVKSGNTGAKYYNKVKTGVEELFNDNPELSNIGSQEQYSAYLDSIFPDSKVKDIKYHGGYVSKNETFDNRIQGDGKMGRGYYFASKDSATEYMGIMGDAPNLISAILNIRNPYLIKSTNEKRISLKKDINKSKLIEDSKSNDSIIFVDENLKEALKDPMAPKNILSDQNDEFKVNFPEQIHILGSKQDIEGFKSFMQTAPAEFKGEGIYYQLGDNVKAKIDNFYNKVKDIAKDMILVDEIKDSTGEVTEKRHYTYKGEKVATTITEKIKKGKVFKERTPEEKIIDDQKKEWGSEGHRFIEKNLLENFIDQDGYALPNFGNKRIESKLPLEVQKQLYAFCKELIASYPKGTRFLIEEKVANLKEKGMIGSTVDFKAIYPVEKKDGTQDMKIDTLDWKFTTVDKTKDEDIPFYKKRDWVPQMGQYVAIDYTYGAKQDQIGKSRMIPFIMNYGYTIAGDKKSGLIPESLEIGKLNSLEETNLYLLPVPVATETTGNPEVDKLIASLQSQWDKLWEKKVSPGLEKDKKTLDLNELSKAIRFLHLKLDFEPLVNVGKTFLNNAADAIKEIKNLDFAKLSEKELNKKLGDLISYKASAEKYAGMDDTFLSYYPRKELTPEGLKIVDSLTAISRSTENMLKVINELEKKLAVQIAFKEGFIDDLTEESKKKFLSAEVVISGLEKSFLEGSKISSRIINLATNLIQVAQKLVNSKVRTQIKQLGEILLPLENEARAKGKKAFDLIATKADGKMSLIKKIDPQFWEKVRAAKKEKNKEFFLNNINLEKYNELAKEAIEQRIADALKREYSSDPETNERYKEYNIESIKNGLDITSESFNGYDNKTFGYLFSKSFKEEKNYSKEYTEMSKSKASLDAWNFFTNLNKKAESLGYIGEYQDSFFPLIEATTLEKFYQTNDVTAQTKDFFTDFYRMKIDEEQQYSKIDPETGKVKENIPKFFTRTNKNIEQLSTDLNKVGALWIKSLEEYESKKNLENLLLTLHTVEKDKNNLITEKGRIIEEAGKPKTGLEENENASVLKVIINDYLYNLIENQESIGNIGLSSVAGKLGKTGEDVEKFEIATKKVIQTGDTLVQALAVGLKPLIAIANWTGQQFQSAIQAGGYYNFWGDYEKNNLKITTNNLSTLEKGLLDLVVPLNEDVSLEERRKLAWKKGFTNYLATWSFTDVMMVSNAFPEKLLQFANAMSFNDNAMVVDGKIVNIRQYLREEDRKTKYAKDANNNYIMSEAERKALEKTFEKRVDELKASPNALKNIAKIENGEVVIPGVSERELAKYSLTITEYARTLNGQMSLTNKAGYRRDAIFSSFMMFKNWIPKLVNVRTGDIKKNVELNTWEYGRTRAFFKTAAYLGRTNILSMIDIINGSEKGLKILDDLLESKRQEHYKKTGQELEITNEEFYDLMREQLWNQSKELMLLFSLLTMCFAAAAAEPPEDATDAEKNAYKWYAKALNKITDEVAFYYNPLSFESMTKGSLLPSIGILSKAIKMLDQVSTEGVGMLIDDEEMMKKAHGLKYTLNIIPGLAQIQTEILPYLYPELAKEMGIRVSKEARR